MKIAVIGQGFVGGAYSDFWESRGHKVIRYGLEPQFADNRDRVREAELVVVAVPTPTTPAGQDVGAVQAAVRLAAPGSVVIVKSTVLPGTTDRLQREWGPRRLLHVPEFLRARHALDDIRSAHRTVIGVPDESPDGIDEAVKDAQALFPAKALFKTSARTAEFIKYAANIMLIAKLVTANALFDAVPAGSEWATVARALEVDPRIGPWGLQPAANGKRGAGGGCFVKDLAAFMDWTDSGFLSQLEGENRRLLGKTGKDLDLLAAIYGQAEAA